MTSRCLETLNPNSTIRPLRKLRLARVNSEHTEVAKCRSCRNRYATNRARRANIVGPGRRPRASFGNPHSGSPTCVRRWRATMRAARGERGCLLQCQRMFIARRAMPIITPGKDRASIAVCKDASRATIIIDLPGRHFMRESNARIII
jgi:hypothetical protein